MEIKVNNEILNLNEFMPENYFQVSQNHFRIVRSGVQRDCFVASDDNHFFVFVEGRSFIFDKVHDKFEFDFSSDAASANRQEIKPPMPGSVVKLLVEEGQKVEEGEGLIIVEAMKMETTIYSSISGTVSEIDAKEGAQVDANKVLMIVEKGE